VPLSFIEGITCVDRKVNDRERLIRYVAMTALAHHPTANWFESSNGQIESAGSHARARCQPDSP
jgi:hypothetical protein